jgi:hypothetical protein
LMQLHGVLFNCRLFTEVLPFFRVFLHDLPISPLGRAEGQITSNKFGWAIVAGIHVVRSVQF